VLFTATHVYLLVVATHNTTSVQSFNPSCIRAVHTPEQNAFNLYISYWCEKQKIANIHAQSRSNKTPNAPFWMRSGGLTAADWQVVNKYILVLQPLKKATKLLEGCGKSGRFGAIYKVIPVLSTY
jgi:hypothetical protein